MYYEEIHGFGFVNFKIRPHLNNKWFSQVTIPHLTDLFKKKPREFYVLDDDCEVQVIDDQVSLIGTGEWKMFTP